MPCPKALWFFIFVLLTASLAAPTPNHKDAPLKCHPNSFAAVLGTLAKDPDGALRLGPDGILRSFAVNGSVIDSRNLSASTFPSFASDTVLRRRRANTHPSPMTTVPPPGIRFGGTGPSQIDPEMLGECSPPLACHNSTSCGGGCGSCTYLGFFPYGLCLAG
ncbi:hypothetical protein BGZ61DRAFT_537564 [Ilyonectria robusta]|uniref:uncharacterized protein n=1 Tax=Ilyonectria robusta TaxID=1079257 RepID=UPI001E8DF6BF|nr:uncharacterized protein BGZ61DRAFT_537564 [Ilyonectria robusta]KAH8669984.1 hypothetical protein BGZ61DRAFT_537564 [Ilyonectria robusta]